MSLRVVGAGLGRTGTHSLKLALEHLLGGPCYHMAELLGRPQDLPVWRSANRGTSPDWRAFLSDYAATVDWPAAAQWREISAAFPDAIILLSVRDADSWWQSASSTIFQAVPPGAGEDWLTMVDEMMARFSPDWRDEKAAKAAFEAHNASVRAEADPARLVEWRAGDGWEPLCAALRLPVPDQPFPHVNTTQQFRAMVGLEPAGDA